MQTMAKMAIRSGLCEICKSVGTKLFAFILFISVSSTNSANVSQLPETHESVFMTERRTIYYVSNQSELIGAFGSHSTIFIQNDIYLNDTIYITPNISDLIIQGNNFKIDGSNRVRCFNISGPSTLFVNLTITNCHNHNHNYGAAIHIFPSSPIKMKLQNCSIVNNTAIVGGAIFVQRSIIEIEDSTISNNFCQNRGGGLYVTSYGSLLLKRSLFESNSAAYGAGMYCKESNVEIEDCVFITNTVTNIVDGGSAIYFSSGTISATNLVIKSSENMGDDIGGVSANSMLCTSPCQAGKYGNCTVATGASLCFVNCECENCPSGSGSSSLYATSSSTCGECGAGQYSKSGSSACSSCAVGRFASNSQYDVGGGLFTQVISGASYCNQCPNGYYAALTSTIVCTTCAAGTMSQVGATVCSNCEAGSYSNAASASCTKCAAGTYSELIASSTCSNCPSHYDSSSGSISCSLASYDYFLDQSKTIDTSKICPGHCNCLGGELMPIPKKGFWVDRRSISKAGMIYPCSRDTCKGGVQNISSSSELSCWSKSLYSSETNCDSNDILCRHGSFGPICGSCLQGFIFSSSSQSCMKCDEALRRAYIACSIIFCLFLIAAAFYTGRIHLPSIIDKGWLVGMLRQADTGELRVLFANYQILDSISLSLTLKFPSPYDKMQHVFSYLSLDFLSLDCLLGDSSRNSSSSSSIFRAVYAWSIAPIIIGIVLSLIFAFRYFFLPSSDLVAKEIMKNKGLKSIIVLSYLVLPPVSRKQFQALLCQDILGHSYLAIDTSVNCASAPFQSFVTSDCVLIVCYMSVPIIWYVSLHKSRVISSNTSGSPEVAKSSSTLDEDSRPLSILYRPYRPSLYFFEVFEMYRRVIFIGILPLISGKNSRKAALGLFFSLISYIFFRETEPFRRASTNALAALAQLVLLVTYGGALVIDSDLSKGVNPFVLGLCLCLANTVILVQAVVLSAFRFDREDRQKRAWRRPLTAEEIGIVAEVMERPELQPTSIGSAKGDIELVVPTDEVQVKRYGAKDLLKEHLLSPKDIHLDVRIGAGAYGEVFRGTFYGQQVAVKTMLSVTEENVKAFRREILLTATLRHPMIVNFVGACWGKELMCLVLEWVSKGSLDGMIGKSSLNLSWDEPLLRLASDVARGMVYLHGHEYFDEADDTFKKCILHRDLKPENVLVTDFMRAKISDFGTSRAKEVEQVTMTAVGTPLYCAPEVFRGESYDEEADVYSFGLMLAAMALNESLLDFIGERWRTHFGKDKVPKMVMRLIRAMCEDGWRPISEDLPLERTPATINSLVIRCCAHDPTARPSFEQVLSELVGPCAIEVESSYKILRTPFDDIIHQDQKSENMNYLSRIRISVAQRLSSVKLNNYPKAHFISPPESQEDSCDAHHETSQDDRDTTTIKPTVLSVEVVPGTPF